MCDEIESSPLTLIPADAPRGRASFPGASEQSTTFSTGTPPPSPADPGKSNDGQAHKQDD